LERRHLGVIAITNEKRGKILHYLTRFGMFARFGMGRRKVKMHMIPLDWFRLIFQSMIAASRRTTFGQTN
jgi:hypothetical protein